MVIFNADVLAKLNKTNSYQGVWLYLSALLVCNDFIIYGNQSHFH